MSHDPRVLMMRWYQFFPDEGMGLILPDASLMLSVWYRGAYGAVLIRTGSVGGELRFGGSDLFGLPARWAA